MLITEIGAMLSSATGVKRDGEHPRTDWGSLWRWPMTADKTSMHISELDDSVVSVVRIEDRYDRYV